MIGIGVLVVVIYVSCSLIGGSFNPNDWWGAGRFLAGLLMMVVGILAVVLGTLPDHAFEEFFEEYGLSDDRE